MKRYAVNYKGKRYISRGASATEAFERFAERQVYGRDLIPSYELDMYDADTRGAVWAQYWCPNSYEHQLKVVVEIA
jgi:hypothetical protein